jgi:hypothetical protein
VLSAESQLTFGGSTMRSTVFLERRLRVHMVKRDRLLFDTAFAPPAKASANVHLPAQRTDANAGGARVTAPCAFVLAETEFDRVLHGADVRSWARAARSSRPGPGRGPAAARRARARSDRAARRRVGRASRPRPCSEAAL